MHQKFNKYTSIYVLLVTFLLLFCAFATAKYLGLNKADPTNRLMHHAMPVAMSVLYQGWPFDYTANRALAMKFRMYEGAHEPKVGFTSIDQLIEKLKDTSFDKSQTYFWVVDDKGLGLYAIIAGAIFGLSLNGLFLFYFFIIGASSLLFIYGNKNSKENVIILYSYLAALCFLIPIFIFLSVSNPGQAIHISEARLFGMLSILPIVHLFLFGIQKREIHSHEMIAVIGQVIIFIFLLHIRSSMTGQMGILVLAVLLFGCRSIRMRNWNIRAIISAVSLVFAVTVALPLFERIFFHDHYFGNSGQRTIWHNAVMGLAYNTHFKKNYCLGVDDWKSALAVLKYKYGIEFTKKTACDSNPKLDEEVNTAMKSIGNVAEYNWEEHERTARNLVFSLLQKYPREGIELFFYNKPMSIFYEIKGYFRNLQNILMKDLGLLLLLSSGFLVMIFGSFLLSFVFLSENFKVNVFPIVFFMGILTIGGGIPPFLFYPALSSVAGIILSLALLVFFCLSFLSAMFGYKMASAKKAAG